MNDSESRMLSRWDIPSMVALENNLEQLAESHEAAERAVNALKSGTFHDGKGKNESLGVVKIPIEQAALIAWLAGHCRTRLSIEVGFGMGMTASIILAARAKRWRPMEHKIFDPHGLPNGRGNLVRKSLVRQFGKKFQWIREKSQVGMAEIALARLTVKSSFIHIDGDHRFDAVFADFFMADQLLAVGGFIVIDDAAFPAIETVVQFVIHNRSDYEVSNLEIPNTAVLRKVARDKRNWDHFTPFPVPQRANWTAAE